jgi:hypothetical protein
MKILMLYTPRSGTNSICSYFLNQNTNYEYFNQPFTGYDREVGLRYSTYDDCIKYDNVLIKSEIEIFNLLKIDKFKILKDFDKVVLISRKDKRKQSISKILAKKNSNFLDTSSRPYFIAGISEEDIDKEIPRMIERENALHVYMESDIPIFYYEDLYYDNFNKLFEYLNITHIESDFKNILDINNKYMSSELEIKKQKTLI